MLLLYSITWWNNRLLYCYFTHWWVHPLVRNDLTIDSYSYGVSSAALNVHLVIVICSTIDCRCHVILNLIINKTRRFVVSQSIVVNCKLWSRLLKNILTTTTNLPMLTRLVGRVGRMGWFEHFFIHSIGRSVDAWEGIGGGGGGKNLDDTYSRSTTTVGLPFTKERIPLFILCGVGACCFFYWVEIR